MASPLTGFFLAVALAAAPVFSWSNLARADEIDGVVRIQSAYGMEETVSRIKKNIADKAILSSTRSSNRSWLRRRASNSTRQRCSCSATHRLARCS